MTLKFLPGDRVKIKELETTGMVRQVSVDYDGNQYYIRYFSNGEARFCYFYGFELEAVE